VERSVEVAERLIAAGPCEAIRARTGRGLRRGQPGRPPICGQRWIVAPVVDNAMAERDRCAGQCG